MEINANPMYRARSIICRWSPYSVNHGMTVAEASPSQESSPCLARLFTGKTTTAHTNLQNLLSTLDSSHLDRQEVLPDYSVRHRVCLL